VAQNVIFVVAAHQLPASFFNPFLDYFKAGNGGRATIDDIASNEYVVWLPVVEVLENSLKSGQVAVYVGDNGDFHDVGNYDGREIGEQMSGKAGGKGIYGGGTTLFVSLNGLAYTAETRN
jgi:hypothetical protein